MFVTATLFYLLKILYIKQQKTMIIKYKVLLYNLFQHTNIKKTI